MNRPNKQGDLVLDLDPIFYQSTTPPNPIPQDSIDHEDTLCVTQTTKRTTHRDSPTKTIATVPSTTQENNFKIKDILAGYVSAKDQNSLAHQYKTVDQRENITTEYTETKSDDSSIDLPRPFLRVNSANSLGYKSNKGVNSSFVAAYQADLREKVRTPQRNTVREFRKSVTNTSSNLERFTPVHRVQRPNSSHGNRTTINGTASKSPGIKLGESLIEREYGVRMETAPDREYASENGNAKKMVVERKETADYFKKQGLQKYENKVLRQELERQMKMMENRVKRLTREDQMITKNIKRTGEIMEKAVANKQRFQDEIMQSEITKQKKIQEQMKAREKIKEEKMKRENNLRSRLTTLHREKVMNVSQVKAVLQQDSVRMNEETRKEEEKKQKIHQATIEFEKLLKLKKQFRHVENKWHTDENHIKFLQEEHMKTLEIENRIQDLARKEEQLIDQIRATQQIQVKADNMMKRVMATKVGKVRQAELR